MERGSARAETMIAEQFCGEEPGLEPEFLLAKSPEYRRITRDININRWPGPHLSTFGVSTMKNPIAAMILFSNVAFGAHITVDVVPDNVEKFGLDVSIKAIDQTRKEGDNPRRVIGHHYRITVKSKKVDLRNCLAALHVENGENSYLYTALQMDPLGLRDGIIRCVTTFSPDYLNGASIIIEDTTLGSSYSYKLSMKEWAEFSEQDGADQPATAPGSKPKGKKKPKPELEVRPR